MSNIMKKYQEDYGTREKMHEDKYTYDEIMRIHKLHKPEDKYDIIKIQVSGGGEKSKWLNLTPEILKDIAMIIKKKKKDI